MNGFNWHDQRGIEGIGFVRTLRTLLTTHLPKLTPGVRAIIDRSFAEELGCTGTANGMPTLTLGLSPFQGFGY
jgi:hypothetical protein